VNENHTEVIIVLDRSGSMSSIREDMEGGLNQFFEEQKKEPGKCTVTLAQFDDKYEIVYEGTDIQEVPGASLVPRNSTALCDAVGRTINAVGKRLSDMLETDRPGRVIFLIITDGRENASKEFSRDEVKRLIEQQEKKYNWLFVYLGANQDSFAEAQGYGIATAKNFTADSKGTSDMLQGASRGVSSYRSGGSYGQN
jgi:uncharacterized protein YegL